MTFRGGHDLAPSSQTGDCEVGELGLIYEVYDRGPGGSQGYSIIFEREHYDGFSPDERASMILVTDELEPAMIGYQFTNVITLCRDYERAVSIFIATLHRRSVRTLP